MPGFKPPSVVPRSNGRSNESSEQLHAAGATAGSGPLALRPREAAKSLGIGERLLWSMTNQRLIPHLRIGKAVVYPVAELQRWLAEQASKGGQT